MLDSSTTASKARLDYKSYGKLEGDIANPEPKNPYTYTGREDDGMGLMYYRARYYDPELEVFISQDPLGDAQRYVGGNPLSFVDPLGLAPIDRNGNICQLGMSESGTCIENTAILAGFIVDMCGFKGFGGGIRSGGTGGATLLREGAQTISPIALKYERITNLVTKTREAKGFTNIGTALHSEIDIAGKAWVGLGYRVSKNNPDIWISADGLRQYRRPSWKPNQGKVQANFERREVPNGKWIDNHHVDIIIDQL